MKRRFNDIIQNEFRCDFEVTEANNIIDSCVGFPLISFCFLLPNSTSRLGHIQYPVSNYCSSFCWLPFSFPRVLILFLTSPTHRFTQQEYWRLQLTNVAIYSKLLQGIFCSNLLVTWELNYWPQPTFC